MKSRKTIFIIAGILFVVLLVLLLPPLPEFPEEGEELDIKKLGENFWVRLYLAVLPSPMPGYPNLMVRDTVWDREGSPHRLKGNLFIAQGVTLTISPGAEVRFDPDVKISSLGRIVAEGQKDRPIVFRGHDEAKGWDLIECKHGSKKYAASELPNLFKHCVIEGGRGLTIRAGSADIEYCTFRNNVSSPIRFEFSSGRITHNTIYGNSTESEAASGNGAGIMVYSDKEVLISHNMVYDNRSVGGRDGGGGIYAFAYDRGKVAVLDNIVHSNYSDRNGGGLVTYECEVERNRVYGNRAEMAGGGIYAIRSRLLDNQVFDNRAGQGGGVYAEECRVHHNLIHRNTAPPAGGAGLYYFGNARIEKNVLVDNASTAGSGGETVMISGGPVLTGNNIIAAGGHALRIDSHSLSPDVDAEGNYWGTADPETIERLVFDWLDNSEVGMVGWDRFSRQWLEDTPPAPDGSATTVRTVKQEHAPHVLRGAINRDTTIGSPDGGHYQVTGNLLVRQGYTLAIHPGTTLELAPEANIRVRGRLTAVGSDKRPIRFTGDPQAPWGNLLFENRSVLDETSGTPASQNKCLLSHCIIENGHGVQMEGAGGAISDCQIQNHTGSGILIREAAARITANRITGNRDGKNGGGIYAYSSFPVEITSNHITDNLTRGDGGGIFTYGYHSNAAIHVADNRIENNRSYGQGGGVWATRSSVVDNHIAANTADGQGGGVYASFAIVSGNRIAENTGFQGGGLFAETNSTLEANAITENRCEDDNGGGVYLNFWGMSVKNEAFRLNRVIGNQAAETGGVYLNGSMIFEKNAIHGNQGVQLYNANPSGEGPFDAPHCYWGSGTREEIEQAIHDGADDPQLSRVEYEPFAADGNGFQE